MHHLDRTAHMTGFTSADASKPWPQPRKWWQILLGVKA